MKPLLHTAKLISITPDAEKIIAHCARVSSPKQTNEKIEGLLKYCATHGHWSVFEMATMTVEITTTRGISPQILRHRSFNFQEFCISGDSLITLHSGNSVVSGTNYKTIEYLYSIQNDSQNRWNRKVRVFDSKTKEFTIAKVKEVFQTGIKPLYQVKTAEGKIIKTTMEHKFLTPDYTWQPLENFKPGDIIGVNGVACHRIKTKNEGVFSNTWNVVESITFVGNEMTYDMEVDHESHNYVANGFCVHNSQRYSDPSQVSETPLPSLIQSIQQMEFRLQDTKNRQNSIEVDQQDFTKFKTRALFLAKVSNKLYQDMLVSGIAKEVARGILPLNVPTRLYMSGTIRSWIHYIQVRAGEATQKEHRLIAESIKTLFKQELPTIGKAVDF